MCIHPNKNNLVDPGESDDKRSLLRKILEEKEAHSNALHELNEERKKSQMEREYVESLHQVKSIYIFVYQCSECESLFKVKLIS